MPVRPHSAGAAIRLLAMLGLALGALALPASGAPGDPGTGRSAGFGALIDGATRASAVAGSGGRLTREAGASGLQSSAGAVGHVEVRVGAGAAGPDGLAEATASASDVLLAGGRIAASSLSVSVEAKAGPSGAHAGLSGYSATGLVVDGQAVDAVPGRQIDVPGLGTLVLFEQVTDAAGQAQANGLRLDVTDPSSGVPAGTQIVIGHVEAQATAGEAAPATAPAPAPPAGATPASPGTGPAPPASGPPARAVSPPVVPALPAPGAAPPVRVRPVPDVLTPLPQPLALPTRPVPSALLSPSAEGYVFPVYGTVNFTDTYGAARADVDWHHGNDIFAPEGTPVLAVADGTLSKVGINRVGGNRLWVTDRRGNSFYYAHLSAFAPAAVDGAQVRAGQVVGFVGHTGDAEATPPHLHFEVHPGDGDSTDPYPYLIAWQRRTGVPQAFEAATVAVGQAPAAGAILVAQTPAQDAPPDPGDTGLATVAP